MILYDQYGLALMFVDLREKTPLPVVIMLTGKDFFSLLVPHVNKINHRIAFVLSCSHYEAVARSAEGTMIGSLVTSLSGGCGSYVVPGWMGLPSVPCSVEWHWDSYLLQGLQLGPQTVGLLPFMQTCVDPITLPGGLCQVTG